jgi:hypothetical protein
MDIRRGFVVLSFGLLTGFGVTLASTLEEDYIRKLSWIPAIGGVDILHAHNSWHQRFAEFTDNVTGREFLEFHRELLAQSDDFRIYGYDTPAGDVDPDAAVIPLPAIPGSLIKFGHTGYGCPRPNGHPIDDGLHGLNNCTKAIDPLCNECNLASSWTTKRTSNFLLRDPTFHGYSANALGANLQVFHFDGHGSIGTHRPTDMKFVPLAVKDGAFFQWHKYIDNIYADWAVEQYRGVDGDGLPIFFSVNPEAQGTAGSSLRERWGSNVYEGRTELTDPLRNPATQYGARPRIGSDIYVGGNAANNNSNRLFAAGTRQWSEDPNANVDRGWDIDAWTVLNLRRQGTPGWFFSVTPGSTGKALTAVNVQPNKGGAVFEDITGNSNALVRTGASLGLAPTDNLDALEIDQQRRVRGTNDLNSEGLIDEGVYDRPKQWFSLRSGTMWGVQALNPATGFVETVSQNDILRFNANGNLVIDVKGETPLPGGLGLAATDDLDALVIVDSDTSNTLSMGDLIYYSLAGPASPAAADIFCKVMGPPFVACAGVNANSLGLLASDDLDALDVRRGDAGVAGPPGAAELPLSGELGACCLDGGTCVPDVDASSCVSPNLFAGPDTACDAAQCPSAHGACCASDGSCTEVSDRACLLTAGTFVGAGISCTSGLCPAAPVNDECVTASVIPYNFVSGYAPPADNTNATAPSYLRPPDPPYSCYDHSVFSGAYGSGTIWYSYTVPAGPAPRRSIYVSTERAALHYPYDGGAGDTRLGLYYAPNGDCSVLQEVACADNVACAASSAASAPPKFSDPPGSAGCNSSTPEYAPLRYDNPQPGRYYLQVSTTYNVERGRTYLTISDPPAAPPAPTPPPVHATIPTMSGWGLAVLTLVFVGSGAVWLRLRRGDVP